MRASPCFEYLVARDENLPLTVAMVLSGITEGTVSAAIQHHLDCSEEEALGLSLKAAKLFDEEPCACAFLAQSGLQVLDIFDIIDGLQATYTDLVVKLGRSAKQLKDARVEAARGEVLYRVAQLFGKDFDEPRISDEEARVFAVSDRIDHLYEWSRCLFRARACAEFVDGSNENPDPGAGESNEKGTAPCE